MCAGILTSEDTFNVAPEVDSDGQPVPKLCWVAEIDADAIRTMKAKHGEPDWLTDLRTMANLSM